MSSSPSQQTSPNNEQSSANSSLAAKKVPKSTRNIFGRLKKVSRVSRTATDSNLTKSLEKDNPKGGNGTKNKPDSSHGQTLRNQSVTDEEPLKSQIVTDGGHRENQNDRAT